MLDEGPLYKAKRIDVDPGRRLSYQRHQQRAEQWFVVSGTATVTVDGRILTVEPGQTVSIPRLAKHRLENLGDDPLVVIEVQFGAYCGEDDIERFEDDFGRVEPLAGG